MCARKKLLAVIALFLLVVSSAVVISGCNKKDSKKYVVSFIADGVVQQTVETAGNETLTLPTAPDKAGYSFDGWFVDEGTWQKPFTADYLKSTKLSANLSVYAKYTQLPPGTYSLSFAGGDGATGTSPTSLTLTEGEQTTLPENPFAKEKHSFLGWNDGTATYEAGDAYTMPNGNVTLTAVWNALAWRVNFNTDGGYAIAGVWVDKGEKLTSLPVAVKQGYVFDNWYIDDEFSEIFYLADDITQDTVLYAKYNESDLLKSSELPQVLLEKQSENFSFAVVGDVALTTANYIDYIGIDSLSGDIPALTVTAQSDGFVLAPASGQKWTAGGLYSIILHSSLDFKGKGHELRQYNVKIDKEEVCNVTLRSDIKYRNSANVAYVSEGIWFVKDTAETLADQLKKGDLLCVWEGTITEDTAFLNVSAVENTALGQLVYAEIADFNTLYDEFDVYQEDALSLDDYFTDVDLDKMSDDIKNGQGVAAVSAMLADNLNKSATVQSFAGDGFYGGIEPIAHPVVITVGSLLQGLSVTCSIGNAYNNNFDYYDWYNDKKYEWTTLSIILSYETVIKNSFKLKIEMEIRETILAFRKFKGDSSWSGILPVVSVDCSLSILSQTDFTLDVMVSPASEDDYTDITGEIQDIIESGSDEKQNIVEKVQDMLAIDGDYIELLSVPIVSQSYFITPNCPVLEVSFAIDLVVKMNFAAGIGTSVSVLTGYAVGVNGNSDSGFQSYSNSIDNLRYSVDAYAYGYMGVKAGFRVGAYLSFAKFQSLGRIGVYGEVGAYIDLYGYLYFHLEQKEETQTPKVTYSFNGGVYAEIGVYVEIGLVAESEFFKARAVLPLYEQKWKLLGLGSEYVLLDIKTVNDNTIISRESSFNVISVLKGEFLNLKTGELVERNLSDGGGLCVYGFDRNWSYDNKTGLLSVKQAYLDAGNKLAKTDFYVSYYGSTLQMSVSNSDAYNLKMSMIYAARDLSGDIEELQSTKTATYVADIEGKIVPLGKTILNYGQKPGPNYAYAYYTFNEATHYVSQDYPASVNEPITEDTTFTIYLKEKQYLVRYTYFNDAGEQVFESFAVKLSDVPALPAGYDIDNSMRKFAGWELKEFPYGPENVTYVLTAQKFSGSFAHRMAVQDKVTNQPLTPMGTNEPSAYNYDENGALYLQSYFAYYEYEQYTVTVVCGNYSDGPVDFNNPSPSLSIYKRQDIWGYEVTIPEFSLIAGYELVGWDRGNDGVGKYGTYDYKFGERLGNIEGDEIYVAVYKHKDCTVALADANGDIVETRSVDYGVSLDSLNLLPDAAPPDVKVNDNLYRKFEKWQIDYKYGDAVDYTSGMLIGSSCTVRPVYRDYYKVEIDLDGGIADAKWVLMHAYEGTFPAYDAEILKDGDEYSAATLMLCIETPTALNKLFPNLYKLKSAEKEFELTGMTVTDGSGDNELNFNEKITVTEPLQIKANFSQKVKIYNVTFRTQYGTFENGTKTTTYTGERAGYDAAMTSVAAEIETVSEGGRDYHFREWRLTTSLYEGNVYAYDAVFWNTASRYTVTLSWGAGSFADRPEGDSFTVEHGEDIIDRLFGGYYVVTPPESAELTYTFTGFMIDGTNTLLTSATSEYLASANIGLTAQFSQAAKKYTITVDPGRGRFPDGSAKPIAVKGDYNTAFSFNLNSVIPTVVSDAAGYTSAFSGWQVVIPQNVAALPTVFDGDYTIVATFAEPTPAEYVLSYYLDGSVTPYITQTYNYGDEIVLPADPPVSEGFVFGGWSRWELPVRSPMVYAATKNAAVYGYSVAERGYKITYKSAGVTVGEDYSASDSVFVPRFFENVTKEGYTFAGWTSRQVVFDKYNSFIMPPCDVTLEAVWKEGMLTISKDKVSETVSINPQNADWYTYEQYTDNRIDNEGVEIGGTITWGVLTVLTDGLTISGLCTNVAIIVAKNVTDLTIKNLTASNDGFSYDTYYSIKHPEIGEAAEWAYDDSVIRVNGSDTEAHFTLHVEGVNSIYVTTMDSAGITAHRNLDIEGAEDGSSILNIVSTNVAIETRDWSYEEDGQNHSGAMGTLRLHYINGTLSTEHVAISGYVVNIDECKLDIVSKQDSIIFGFSQLLINQSTIKGSGGGFKAAICSQNVHKTKTGIRITGLCNINVTSKTSEALGTNGYADYGYAVNGDYEGGDVYFDLAEGSRIVLVGGNTQQLETPISVLDAEGNDTTLCWAVCAERGEITFSQGCKVNAAAPVTFNFTDIQSNQARTIGKTVNNNNHAYNTVVILCEATA